MNTRTGFLLSSLLLAAPAVAADVPEFNLVIQNNQFAPAVLDVPAGVKVKLVVQNRDSAVEEFESHDLNREKLVPPGSKTTIYIGPLKPGSYKYFGEFHPKTALGVINAK